MHAGKIAQLQTPASDPLEDTTQSGTLPALAVNNTQQDLEGDAAAQHCTLADAVQTERPEPMVYDGGITEVMEPHTVEVISDVVADVTGSGIVVAERMRKAGRYPFPLNLIAAQTGREIQPYSVDVTAFADHFDGGDIHDTWMVGTDYGDGSTIHYNADADSEHAGEANIGLGFELSWNDVVAEGVIYESGYLAIYSEWTSAVFLQFVEDAVLPHTFVGDNDSQQQTLGQ
jgi:hypothetical protein